MWMGHSLHNGLEVATSHQLQVVVGILQRCEARLLEMTDMEKMVAFLRTEVPQWRHDALQAGPPRSMTCLPD